MTDKLINSEINHQSKDLWGNTKGNTIFNLIFITHLSSLYSALTIDQIHSIKIYTEKQCMKSCHIRIAIVYHCFNAKNNKWTMFVRSSVEILEQCQGERESK